MSCHQQALDESSTNRTNPVRSIKVWLGVVAVPTVLRIPHVGPASHPPSQKTQNDRDEKGDVAFHPFYSHSLDLFSCTGRSSARTMGLSIAMKPLRCTCLGKHRLMSMQVYHVNSF